MEYRTYLISPYSSLLVFCSQVLTDHSHLLKTTPDLVNASQDLKDRVFGVNECGPDSVDPIEVILF